MSNKIMSIFLDSEGKLKKKNLGILIGIIGFLTIAQIIMGALPKKNANTEEFRYSIDNEGNVVTGTQAYDGSNMYADGRVSLDNGMQISEETKTKDPDTRLAKGGIVVGYDLAAVAEDCAAYEPVQVQNVTLTAAVDSGSFQIANKMFTIPSPLSLFTDNGVSIVAINSRNTMTASERKLEGGASSKVILYYRGCVFNAEVRNFGENPIDILDGQVEFISEDMTVTAQKKNTNHIYTAGGVGVGVSRTAMIGALKQPNSSNISNAFTNESTYRYGESVYFATVNDTNYLDFTIEPTNDTVTAVAIYRNLIGDIASVPIETVEAEQAQNEQSTVSSNEEFLPDLVDLDDFDLENDFKTINVKNEDGKEGTAVQICREPSYSYLTDANGKPLSDYSVAPVSMSISYTDADLKKARYKAEDADKLIMYRYDDKSGKYIAVGGKVDKEAHTVSCSISKPGEYVIAIDSKLESRLK